MLRSPVAIPVTICVSAYNEAPTIVDSIQAMLTLEYPQYEVVLANDGSTDGTLAALIDGFDLRRVDQPLRTKIETAPVRGRIPVACAFQPGRDRQGQRRASGRAQRLHQRGRAAP